MGPRSAPDAVLTARLTGGALSAAARIGRVGELAGNLVPVSPALYPAPHFFTPDRQARRA